MGKSGFSLSLSIAQISKLCIRILPVSGLLDSCVGFGKFDVGDGLEESVTD